jgi:hypothetical protein
VQFFDRFNSVKRPNGETRYWQPDLTAYEHPAVLPDESKPDTLGLHRHQDKTLLPLENKRYAVSENPLTGEHRIDHPTRPEAYKPRLKHNRAGTWQTEVDQPLSWDQTTLLRRIGPDMQRFSEREREGMLTISGTHENVLRKMHTHAGPLPPVLADTLKRFTIDQDIQTFIEQIGSDRPELYLKADPVTQLELLNANGYWPKTKGLQLTDGEARTLWQSPAPDVPRVPIDATQLKDGDLLKTFLLALSDEEARTLMGEEFGLPSLASKVVRAACARNWPNSPNASDRACSNSVTAHSNRALSPRLKSSSMPNPDYRPPSQTRLQQRPTTWSWHNSRAARFPQAGGTEPGGQVAGTGDSRLRRP